MFFYQTVMKLSFKRTPVVISLILKTKFQKSNRNNTNKLGTYMPNDVVAQKELHPYNFYKLLL